MGLFLEKIIAFWFKCMKWVVLGRLYMVGAMSNTQTSMGTGHMLWYHIFKFCHLITTSRKESCIFTMRVTGPGQGTYSSHKQALTLHSASSNNIRPLWIALLFLVHCLHGNLLYFYSIFASFLIFLLHHSSEHAHSVPVTSWTVPHQKRSPRTVHGRIIGLPGPNITAIPGPTLLPMIPHAADYGLFAIAFATTLAYGEQPGHCLFNQNKMRQQLVKSLQEGEMTPLPLKKNRR